MSQWKTVFKTNQQYQAEIVKDVLEGDGLTPVIVNKKDSAYHFGYFEVNVSEEEVLKAMQIIQNDINFE
ncbi:MAG: DUF2007 domain-containing protein [Cyclobacteriaceae bacterium]